MSAVDPFVPGGTLLSWRLVERASPSVWQAEDTRSAKKVAIKVLTRQLPRDAAKRDGLIRDVRLGAALYHASLVNILEVTPAGDALLLVMDWFDGQPASTVFRSKPADRTTFFRVAYQLADALKLLQAKNTIHGNIAGDSVLVSPTGHVRLAGLNVTNLVSRKDAPSTYQQKSSDLRAVSYMAPEQIRMEPLTPQSDIFSIGVVLYEVAIGRLPYVAGSAAEAAHKIVDEQPSSPKSINPNVDNAVLAVMGKCLFKDTFKRQKDAKSLVDDIIKTDPEAAKFAGDLAKALAGAPVAKASETRKSILFMADVANYDELNAADPASAQKMTARMQQILGEAVYLFDGQVVDPFGPFMVAELPSVDSALEAGRKGEFDFSLEQQGEAFIPVRLLLHAGDVWTRDGKVVGAAVDRGCEVLKALDPLQLFVSEDFAKKGRGNVRLRDAGARAGVKLYAIAPAEEEKKPARVETAAAVQQPKAAEAAEAAAVAPPVDPRARQKRLVIAAVAAAMIGAFVAGGLAFFRPKKTQPVPVAAMVPAGLPPATAARPRKVLVAPFTVQAVDPALQQRAESVRLAAIEVLRNFPEVRIVGAPAPDVSAFTATMTGDATTAQLVPATTGPSKHAAGSPVALADASSGIQSLVQWVSNDLKLSHPVSGTPEAYNAFADAVVALNASDPVKGEAAIRAAIKADPNLLPAQLLAMRFFESSGKDADALAAAKQASVLDPSNAGAARVIAHEQLKAADPAGAINAYAAILRHDRDDVEALNAVGRFAVAVGDAQKLTAVLSRLSAIPNQSMVHDGDLLMAAGRIDAAADKYYEAEQRQQDNPALALKIGRIAVLRHSKEIADTELKQLVRLHWDYGIHILKAYMAAESGAKNDAVAELKAAEALSTPGDDYWTNHAEVAAINGDPKGVVDALQKASDRKEPTAGYVLSNRLFAFLQSDADFLKTREKFAAEQAEIRAALANVAL